MIPREYSSGGRSGSVADETRQSTIALLWVRRGARRTSGSGVAAFLPSQIGAEGSGKASVPWLVSSDPTVDHVQDQIEYNEFVVTDAAESSAPVRDQKRVWSKVTRD